MSAIILPTRRDTRPKVVSIFPLALVLGISAIAVLVALHLVVGTVDLTPAQVLAALLDQADDALHRQVVWGLRLPRALTGVLAGAMLGLAGAILQTVTRNPLADPGLLGVTSGGVLAIVVGIVIGGHLTGGAVQIDAGVLLPLLALVGGLAAGLLSYALSWHNGGSDPVRLILAGVLVGGMCSAATSLMLLWADGYNVQRIIRWTIGSLNGRVWIHWHTIWPVALIALPIGLLCAGLANVLQLGDGIAAALGLRVERARMLLLFAAALLTAGAVAVVGNVGFIGLIGPHMARRITGGDVRRLFPLSTVISVLLLLASDLIARTLTIGWVGQLTGLDLPENAGLPVGAVMALLGAPFFLYLLLRRR
jgi:iron complex transport system permease protein